MNKQQKILMIIFLLAFLTLFTGCNAIDERLAAGTAVAAGHTPVGQGGGGEGTLSPLDPAAIATALQLTLAAFANQTPDFTDTPLPVTDTPTSTLQPATPTTTPFPPAPTLPPPPTPTSQPAQLTALAQTLAATTPGATNVTPSGPAPSGTPQETTGMPGVTPTTEIPCNAFRFVAHVNYPLGSIVQPNTAFYKSWQVQNTGRCTWNAKYSLVYHSGYQLGGPSPLAFGTNVVVKPDQYVTLTIALFTPPQPGTYYSYWWLQDKNGNLFGGGPNRDEPLQVEVIVPGTMPPLTTNPVSTAPPFYTVTPTP